MKLKLIHLVYLVWAGSLIILSLVFFPGLEKSIVGVKIVLIAFCAALVWILHTAFSILSPRFYSRWTDDVPTIEFRTLITFVFLGITLVLISEFLRGVGILWLKYLLFASIFPSVGLLIFQMTDSAEKVSLNLSWRFHKVSMILLLLFLSGSVVY